VAQTVILDGRIIVISEAPQTLQLYPRESNDSAVVKIAGKSVLSAGDTLIFRSFRNSNLISQKFSTASENHLYKDFLFHEKIPAGLNLYRFELILKNDNEIIIFSRDSIICGDVYLILGQSNSHPTNDSAEFSSVFCRSFGTLTGNGNYDPYEEEDTLWGISNAHGFGCRFCGDYMVGVWGLKLQQLILEKYSMPSCVINVGTGGSTIEQNLKDSEELSETKTIYGKMLYRLQKSKTIKNVKALFWYQGEANSDDSWVNYEKNFDNLYKSWKQDIPGIGRYYIFQTRPGCDGENQSELRDVQRRITKKYTDVSIISTTGIGFHDGCHYSVDGYYQIGELAFRNLEYDFYTHSNKNYYISPDVLEIGYTDKTMKNIRIKFNRNLLSLSVNELDVLKDYFISYPDNQKPSNIRLLGNNIYLSYQKPNYSNEMRYLPNKFYNNSSSVYEGPFLKSDYGVGALSFIEKISLFEVDEMKNGQGISCYPNPACNTFTLHLTLKHYSEVRIQIYDIQGREIKEYFYHGMHPGDYEVEIPAQSYPSGVYFIYARTNHSLSNSKVIILK